MQLFFILLFFFSPLLISANINRGHSHNKNPLYLTPFIESGSLEEGRKQAEVKPFLSGIKSYSGLLTVDKAHDSNLFFWYFPSERKAADVPLLLWLNGYSTASTYGVFLQTGPYDHLTPKLRARDYSWQKYYHVVYIDSPVGVGYSFTNSTEGYSTDLDKVSLNLQIALEQFLQLFPNLQGRELYLTGLSLVGKYVPALAHRIYQNDYFNLKGIFLGNPVLDIGIQMRYENYLYELGFIDKNQQPELIEHQEKLKALSQTNEYEKFNNYSDNFWLNSDSYLVNITGLDNVFDYEDNVVEWKYYSEFIQNEHVKKALHVTGIPYNDGSQAMRMFGKGIAFSVLGYLGDMLESVDMMFYAGQNDVSIAYPMMIDALAAINWSGKADYAVTPRQRLYKEDGRHIWGYSRNYKTLSDVMVRKAGHSAVTSQPKHVLWLLKKFTNYNRFD